MKHRVHVRFATRLASPLVGGVSDLGDQRGNAPPAMDSQPAKGTASSCRYAGCHQPLVGGRQMCAISALLWNDGRRRKLWRAERGNDHRCTPSYFWPGNDGGRA